MNYVASDGGKHAMSKVLPQQRKFFPVGHRRSCQILKYRIAACLGAKGVGKQEPVFCYFRCGLQLRQGGNFFRMPNQNLDQVFAGLKELQDTLARLRVAHYIGVTL